MNPLAILTLCFGRKASDENEKKSISEYNDAHPPVYTEKPEPLPPYEGREDEPLRILTKWERYHGMQKSWGASDLVFDGTGTSELGWKASGGPHEATSLKSDKKQPETLPLRIKESTLASNRDPHPSSRNGAILPSEQRTSRSFIEAAKKPRDDRKVFEVDRDSWESDPIRAAHIRQLGREIDDKEEAAFEKWRAAVRRGRGCT